MTEARPDPRSPSGSSGARHGQVVEDVLEAAGDEPVASSGSRRSDSYHPYRRQGDDEAGEPYLGSSEQTGWLS